MGRLPFAGDHRTKILDLLGLLLVLSCVGFFVEYTHIFAQKRNTKWGSELGNMAVCTG